MKKTKIGIYEVENDGQENVQLKINDILVLEFNNARLLQHPMDNSFYVLGNDKRVLATFDENFTESLQENEDIIFDTNYDF